MTNQMFAALVRITETAGEVDVDARTIGMEESYTEEFAEEVEERLDIDVTEVDENAGPFIESIAMMQEDLVSDEAIQDRLITALMTHQGSDPDFVVIPHGTADFLEEFLDAFDEEEHPDIEKHRAAISEALEL